MSDDRVPPAELAARHDGAVRHRTTVEVDAESFASAAAAAETWGVGTFTEHQGRVLLVREGDTWLLPGGACDPRESHVEGAVRETREETGIAVQVVDLAAVTVRTFVHGEESVEFYFATFRATPDGSDVAPSTDPGRPGEAVDEAAWHRTVPAATFDRELVVGLRGGDRRRQRD